MPNQERKTKRNKTEEPGLPATEELLGKKEGVKKFLGDMLSPKVMTLSGGLRVRFFDGQIQLDKSALEAEMQRMDDTLQTAIASGDENILTIYLRNVEQMEDDEEAKALAEKMRLAFKNRDPKPLQLDAIHVDDISRGIAERNLIREGLRGQIARQPFTFRDARGKTLDSESDIDFVFARDTNDSSRFKIIVGSKKGIDTIAFPQDEAFPRGMFRPDMGKVDKDAATETIAIPMKPSQDGNPPQAVIIEIRKGPIDLPNSLAEEERVELKRRRDAEEAARQAQYNPPPRSNTNYGYASR